MGRCIPSSLIVCCSMMGAMAFACAPDECRPGSFSAVQMLLGLEDGSEEDWSSGNTSSDPLPHTEGAGEGNGWQPGDDIPDTTIDIGSQGGFHAWMNIRATGLCPDTVEFQYTVKTVDTGEFVAQGRAPLFLQPESNGWNHGEDLQLAIVCPPPPEMDVVDRAVRITVVVKDAHGAEGQFSRDAVLRCPQEHPDVLNTCRRICNRELN